MILKRVIVFLAISLLVFVMAGGISMVAAAEGDFFPGAGSDPDFLSPGWKPALITPVYSDNSDFLLPGWKPALITPIYSENSDFLLPSWKPAKTISYSDPDLLNKNWSVHTPVLYRYNLMDTSVINNYHLDPFMSYTELKDQGWNFGKDLTFW